MSLLDAFKPKWQNSNPDKRIEAVSELGLQNQDTLERIALTDEDANVRTSAIKKLNVIATLQRIAKNDNDASVRRLAETRYYEEISKKLKDFNEPATAEILQFIDEIKDSRFADDLMKNMKSSELRQALVSKCTKISLLTLAANRDAKEQIAKAAVEQITSEQALQDIAKNSKHTSVRKIAADKLRASKEAKDNGKKAEELLASKREALIKQAHFFAAQKDTTDTRPKFEALMDEAKTLGMGQSQAELDDIYNSFIKFVNEADAARLQAIKAEEDKKANIERLYISLDELDSIIKNNLVDEKSARVTEILTDCASFKSIMDANLLKRYSLVSLRIDEAKKSTEIAEQAAKEDSEISGNRTTLLEQLQALADTDADDMTEKHLRSIVREWEKLPLLEGADPVLQSYNALRNKLSEKITSYSEASQKTIEENSKKLRVLIEKINAIDENQDFKEIHKVLRETYQEWKNIVGEQKFKYHDLWQEYKNATSRFRKCSNGNPGTTKKTAIPFLKKWKLFLVKQQARLFLPSSVNSATSGVTLVRFPRQSLLNTAKNSRHFLTKSRKTALRSSKNNKPNAKRIWQTRKPFAKKPKNLLQVPKFSGRTSSRPCRKFRNLGRTSAWFQRNP